VGSLVRGGHIHWRKIFLAAGLWFVLTTLSELILFALAPGTYSWSIDWSAWLLLMMVVLAILPFQTTFEEVFVRGYLLQGIGIITQRPWIAIIVTAFFFGLMHISNPEIEHFGVGVMMVYYVSVGVFLAAITVVDNGLEYALGIHLATNVYGAGFVSYTGSALQTDALVKVHEISPSGMIALCYASMVIFIILMMHNRKRSDWKVLFERVRQEPPPETDETITIGSSSGI
jgi:membrane protease YdiL (CAAX protease family)